MKQLNLCDDHRLLIGESSGDVVIHVEDGDRREACILLSHSEALKFRNAINECLEEIKNEYNKLMKAGEALCKAGEYGEAAMSYEKALWYATEKDFDIVKELLKNTEAKL